jgi:hypothetical protein
MPCTCWIRGSALQDSKSLPISLPAALTNDRPRQDSRHSLIRSVSQH